MSGPSVVVERAPDGWTHIGGPGMHLLIALDEDDDRTLTARDAADRGDLDDVIEVLTAGGMRKAHHFVGVHWLPRTRLVAFGPVAAVITLPDGTEQEVRPASTRVWTDLELAEHPERVVLRVLDEATLREPAASAPVGAPAPADRPGATVAPGRATTSSQAGRPSPTLLWSLAVAVLVLLGVVTFLAVRPPRTQDPVDTPSPRTMTSRSHTVYAEPGTQVCALVHGNRAGAASPSSDPQCETAS